MLLAPQVFLNLTKDLPKGENADPGLPQDAPGCLWENDETSLNSDSLTERDGIILFRMRPQAGQECTCWHSPSSGLVRGV